MEQAVRTLQDRVNAALLGSDWQALDELVSPNAPIIAPEGVIITRDKWIGVHNESDYQPVRLETSETDVHTYDHAGIRFDVVDSECTCNGGNRRRSLPGHPGLGHRPRQMAARGGAVHLAVIAGLPAPASDHDPATALTDEPKGAHMPTTATPPPDPGALSGLVVGLSFIGGIGGANALAPYPRPGASPSQLRQYFTQNPGPTRLSATGQAISAVSLARFTASVARLAGRTGRGSRALQTAAVAGGALAAASLAASAACAAALSGRWGRQETSAAALVRREFIAGGVLHTPAFGILLGALGLAGLRTGELPRQVAITALASASTCLLSPLYFVAEPLAWFIPAGRFPGLIVSGIAGVRLAAGAQSGP